LHTPKANNIIIIVVSTVVIAVTVVPSVVVKAWGAVRVIKAKLNRESASGSRSRKVKFLMPSTKRPGSRHPSNLKVHTASITKNLRR